MVILAKIAVGMCATVAVGAAYLIQDGFVHVGVDEYREGGTHLHLAVPAMVAPLAIHFVPARHLEEAHERAAEWLPTARIAIEELRKLPDTEFVYVHDSENDVHVSKIGGGINVDVRSPDEHVKVWVPLRAAYDAASALEERFGEKQENFGSARSY